MICPVQWAEHRATKNDSEDWFLSHMKHPVQCAGQKESPCKFTKYCASHQKPLLIGCRRTWNVQDIARGNRNHPQHYQIGPVTKNRFYDFNTIRMGRSNRTHSNVTKYWACDQNDIAKYEEKLWKNGWSVMYNGWRFERDPSVVTFSGRRSVWWCCSIIFCGRCNMWWCWNVYFRGKLGQHLVMLEWDFSWCAQHLVMLQCHFSWQKQHLVILQGHFLSQTEHMVILECDFRRQGQHLVTPKHDLNMNRSSHARPFAEVSFPAMEMHFV